MVMTTHDEKIYIQEDEKRPPPSQKTNFFTESFEQKFKFCIIKFIVYMELRLEENIKFVYLSISFSQNSKTGKKRFFFENYEQ